MSLALIDRLDRDLAAANEAGTYKRLKSIESPIGARIKLHDRGEVTLLSSNDYLGFANHPEIIAAAKRPWMRMAQVPHPFALFVGRRMCTKNWSKNLRHSMERKPH